MKKIWPWALLLLLLLVFCTWNHRGDAAVPAVAPKAAPVDYVITLKEGKYTLNAHLISTAQLAQLSKPFSEAGKKLSIHSTYDKTLIKDDAVALTHTLLPHFIANYSEGEISYHHQTLQIHGRTANQKIPQAIQKMLTSTATVKSEDHTQVILPQPIHYRITKVKEEIAAEGLFGNKAQSRILSDALPTDAKILLLC